MSHLMNTYARLPVAFERGQGVWLWDTQGRRYLDALCGIAVTGIGHAHPTYVRAVSEQAGRLVHASNLYRIPEQERLSERLCEVSGMDSVFFCNSGCEANEAATVVPAVNCGAGSVPLLTPMTANAAAELVSGNMYVSAVAEGSFTVTHTNSATAGRTFRWAIQG